jgi:hypothetical protein
MVFTRLIDNEKKSRKHLYEKVLPSKLGYPDYNRPIFIFEMHKSTEYHLILRSNWLNGSAPAFQTNMGEAKSQCTEKARK